MDKYYIYLGWVFFMIKGQREEKKYFYRKCRFFYSFLIGCLYPRQKRSGYTGLLLYVRSFVRSVVTLFRLSDTLFNLARTGVSISKLWLLHVIFILIPLLSTDLTLLLWSPTLKEATKSKGQAPAQ